MNRFQRGQGTFHSSPAFSTNVRALQFVTVNLDFQVCWHYVDNTVIVGLCNFWCMHEGRCHSWGGRALTLQLEKEYTSADVTLYVNEQGRQGQPTSSPSSEPEKNGVPYAIGGVLLIISLLSIVFLTVRYRQRHLRSNVEVPDLPDGEQLESLNP
ncbi:hypothetical protein ANANG_G00275700 [Anguilla anguilla]|uniref:Uncharacterized protein n=1 Tax=Anguilla anguilla TaxID=7936 RepID=A0A9D3RKF6_ANGAN|nr:hypothetical protein ANANG_G00275700 [Anguilla anguilla]